jgi:hypothetical protein
MRANEAMLIRVYGAWNGWQNAEVRIEDIRRVHWFQPDHAPHHLLYGFVSCTDFVTGHIPHECDNSSAPHDLRVCVLKRHVVPSAYAELASRATVETFANDRGGSRLATRGALTIRRSA